MTAGYQGYDFGDARRRVRRTLERLPVAVAPMRATSVLARPLSTDRSWQRIAWLRSLEGGPA